MQAKNPSRDLPIAILSSLSLATVLYLLMSFAICLMIPYYYIDIGAPFSAAFLRIDGWHWVSYLVSVGAVFGLGTVLLVSTKADKADPTSSTICIQILIEYDRLWDWYIMLSCRVDCRDVSVQRFAVSADHFQIAAHIQPTNGWTKRTMVVCRSKSWLHLVSFW